MGYDTRFGNVRTQHEDIPEDEPVFMVRARDTLSIDVIATYMMRSIQSGSSKEHLRMVMGALEEFRYWQEHHPEEMHVPDSKRHGGMADV